MPLTVMEAGVLTLRGQTLDRAGVALDVVGSAVVVAGTTWAILERLRTRKNTEAKIGNPLSTHALAWGNQ